MAEWSNAVDSKSIVPISGTWGSNPYLTANKTKDTLQSVFFCFICVGRRDENPRERGATTSERQT